MTRRRYSLVEWCGMLPSYSTHQSNWCLHWYPTMGMYIDSLSRFDGRRLGKHDEYYSTLRTKISISSSPNAAKEDFTLFLFVNLSLPSLQVAASHQHFSSLQRLRATMTRENILPFKNTTLGFFKLLIYHVVWKWHLENLNEFNIAPFCTSLNRTVSSNIQPLEARDVELKGLSFYGDLVSQVGWHCVLHFC